ncbi:hypothetical protein NM688_g9354 [Phlebia brevispora]|uniref:Uncharacterized protein n=1 Tax=Phlebia brevispora TaxID=194682 RepID=A0ACC1RHA0_9APHY|nr:hypothetical protein NM688_g9354 [Phlebia brevispora]
MLTRILNRIRLLDTPSLRLRIQIVLAHMRLRPLHQLVVLPARMQDVELDLSALVPLPLPHDWAKKTPGIRSA